MSERYGGWRWTAGLVLGMVLGSGAVVPCLAVPVDPAFAEQPAAPVLAPVVVVGRPEVLPANGQSVLDGGTAADLPQRGTTIDDLLTLLPGVQAGEAARSSLTGGEILPPDLSISGGKTYQNHYRIDGLGNNNLVDPMADDPTSATLLPGHPQELFLAPELVEQATVYDSNIPARFGGFTGGVVDVQTRRPGPEVAGHLSYRTTRSTWTQLFVPEEDAGDFRDSNNASQQPSFTRHQGGVLLDLPLGPESGVLASYQQSFSRIPLKNLGESKDQYRRNENYFLKVGGAPAPGSYLAATLLWAPYREKYFRPDTRNGDFTVDGGGLRIGGEWEQALPMGTWHLTGGFRQSRNERVAALNLFGWNADSATVNWGQQVGSRFSYEGGLGNLETVQKTLELHTDLELAPLSAGPAVHRGQVGLDLQRVHARYDRPQTGYVYFPPTSLTPEVVCPPGAADCIAGEQFQSRRQVYAATHLATDLSLLAAWAEDRIAWGPLELRPGLRLSWDDFMDNLDLAPRLAASWDLFGAGRTVLVAGLNRYYGTTLVAYKLREAFSPFTPTETRSLDPQTHVPGPWSPDRAGTLGYRYSGLKTPYSDEWTAGLRQQLWGGVLDLRYLNRQGHDQFARERLAPDADGVRNYVLNNNGSSDYQSVRVFWERYWAGHYLLLDGTWQDLRTDTENYNTALDINALREPVFYNGELLFPDELPATDYNRPWVANLTYVGKLPYGFTFSNVTRYHAPYRALGDTRKNTPEGYDIYGEIKHPAALTFDWKLAWQTAPVRADQVLTFSLEIFNVFNRRIRVGTADTAYELGRQFWAGVDYRF